ncbi:ABC transporter ATP-binding protein [Nocardia speluncae]|uniref:ABC transporter ATP-binding protein n=1 Tax=Nocardia speluncae TaxID=419477 RepID=A0A846XGT9_9NOCA|nr:ABC transporter ATP-binding protein [Nocardia speluncae]NKY34677.1 ABC transporter ATP-binding protein [Nocardia speluncae]
MGGGKLLELSGIRIGFGDGPDVIADTSLVMSANEFVSVIGPSGCGKSTILNAVAGLMPVRSGRVDYRGKTVQKVNTDVGYMTQGDTLLPWRTVQENIATPLKLRGFPKAAIRRKVDALMKMLDLVDAADKFPAQLSGGMKRRALLARSMIYEPELLLMDEPFAALDAQLRTQMHRELRRTIAETGQAVLFITHDIFEAVLLSDRVVVLGGRPAAPISEHHVPFGPDRDVEALRFDPEFVRLEKRVHDALGEARTMSKAAS